jgi:putative membrane protein
MSIASQVFAVAVAALHVLIFLMESVLWMRPDVHRRFGVRSVADAEGVRRFAFNQGFYNLFLAIGIALGLVLWHSGQPVAGRTLVVFGCACVLAAALVLVGSDRRMWRAALIQGAPAALALAAF